MGIVRFEDKYMRKTEHNGEIYFSVEDLVAILTDSVNPKDYIKKMRSRDPELSKGWGQIVTTLALPLTNEWDLRGAVKKDYELFTALMSKSTFGITPVQHKAIKRLKRENLRDNMTDMELALVNIGELTAKELHRSRNTKGRRNLQKDVAEAGKVAGDTRRQIEQKTGKSVLEILLMA